MPGGNRKNESGQSLIVVAAIVLVLLALVALVVDVGNAYSQRRILQNAVDAAAMAGALKLVEHEPDGGTLVGELAVWRAINDYATVNGLASDKWVAWFVDSSGVHAPDTVDQFMLPVPDWANGIELKGQRPFDTYFAHLLGFDVLEVAAEASVYMLWGPCSADKIFPLTINIANFEGEPEGLPVKDKEYILFEKTLSASARKVPGWWWVHWEPRGSGDSPGQGPSDTVLNCNMIDPSRSGTWRSGNWVQRADGVKSWPEVEAVLRARIESSGATVATCDDPPRYVTLDPYITIPLFDKFEDKGCGEPWDADVCDLPEANDVYRIVGFAQFELTCFKKGDKDRDQIGDCSGCGAEKEQGNCIKGKFVSWIDDSAFEDGCKNTLIVAPSFRRPGPTVTPLP